jgi:hypothetical protein
MATIALMKTPAENGLAQHFEAVRKRLPGDSAARADAFRRFTERGLPHRRIEEFRYTDLRALMKEAAPLVERLDAPGVKAVVEAATALAALETVKVAIVNGHVERSASDLDQLPAGVEIVPLAEAMAAGHGLLAQMSPVPQGPRKSPLPTEQRLHDRWRGDPHRRRHGRSRCRSICVSSMRGRPPSPRPLACSWSSRKGLRSTLFETHEGPTR